MGDDRADVRVSILVQRATDIVAAQLECGVIDAYDALRARAVESGESLEHLALDIIDRIVRFDH